MTDLQSDDSSTSPKLNILALPRLTSILFALILGTVLGIVGLACIPGSQIWWVPLAIGFTLLPLRGFLGAPDRWLRRHKLTKRADEATLTIEDSLLSLSPDPSMFVSVVTTEQEHLYDVKGTFRRRFWGLDSRTAARIATDLRSSKERKQKLSQTFVSHTLGYFLNRDAQRIELSKSLLMMQLLTIVVYICSGLIFVSFLGRFGPEVLSPGFWRNLSESFGSLYPGFPSPNFDGILQLLTKLNPTAAAQLADPALAVSLSTKATHSLIAAMLPVFLCILVLYRVHFAQLMRGAMLYADAKAAMLLGEAIPLVDMIPTYRLMVFLRPHPDGSHRVIALIGERIHEFITQVSRMILGRASALTLGERVLCLERPELVIGSVKSIALVVGLNALILELIQRGFQSIWFGTPSQDIAPFVYYVPSFIVFAIWLMPQLVQQPVRPLLPRITELILIFMAIRLVPSLVDLMVVGIYNLGELPRSGPFAAWLFRAMLGSSGELLTALPIPEGVWTGFISQNVIRPFIYSLLMASILITILWIEAKLSQCVLTWYQRGRRVLRLLYGINGMFTVVLGLGIIPLISHLVFPARHPVWSGAEIGGLATALVTLVFGVSVLWFMGRHQLAGAHGVTLMFRAFIILVAHASPVDSNFIRGLLRIIEGPAYVKLPA